MIGATDVVMVFDEGGNAVDSIGGLEAHKRLAEFLKRDAGSWANGWPERRAAALLKALFPDV